MPDEVLSISEAARIAGVSAATLRRWAASGVVPIRDGRWTEAAAAQARVVARMRERGHSLGELRKAVAEGRLATGYVERMLPSAPRVHTLDDVAELTGLERGLIERIMNLLGTPAAVEGALTEQDAAAISVVRDVLQAGLPLVAVLQLVRVYAQSIRRIAEAEVRLFHLFVHEPMIREGVDALDMAEHMQSLARDLLPVTSPLMEYLHHRYLRFFLEQDVIGHMEADFGGRAELGEVLMTFCFVDLTGFTRFTEEEGDAEALDLIERFVETVETTLPAEALLVKTIGDEAMIVSRDPGALTGWAVEFLALFGERPQPRVGLHCGRAVYRDGDYFGSDVNLTHAVLTRAIAGEVIVTAAVVDAIGESGGLELEPIGRVELKGFGSPAELYTVRAGDPGEGTDRRPRRNG